jgi:hypothetical protein
MQDPEHMARAMVHRLQVGVVEDAVFVVVWIGIK